MASVFDPPKQKGFLQSLLETVGNTISSSVESIANSKSPGEAALRTGAELASIVASPITSLLTYSPEAEAAKLYHASPYKFDKFRLANVGEGQGAQSYGHGLYFAESPKVLEQYEIEMAAKAEAALAGIENNLVVQKNIYSNKSRPVVERTAALDAIKKYELDLVKAKQKFRPTSYIVDVPDAEITKMLNWDKPVALHPPAVRSALMDIIAAEELFKGRTAVQAFGSGRDFLQALTSKVAGPKEASQYLLDAGIPGVRYLDARSKILGGGTSNFAIADEDIIEILSKKEIK